GTITDEYGDPLQDASVRVLQIRRVGDRLAALAAHLASVQESDDRGAYRIFGLTPGRYIVAASESMSLDLAEPNARGAYAPVFYPAATSIVEASPVRLDSGDALGIDIAFRPQRTMRVTGTGFDSAGRPISGVILSVSQRSGAIMLEPRRALVAPDGTF